MEKKRKGIVMETAPGKVIIFTSEGEFLQGKWSGTELPSLGSEIELAVAEEKRVPIWQKKIFYLAASMLLFLLSLPLALQFFQAPPSKAVAYVTVDINPSVELGIDEKDIVLEARGLNQEGEELLSQVELAKLHIDEAVAKLTEAAVAAHYLALDKENQIMITVSSDEKPKEQVEKLKVTAEKVLAQNNLKGESQLLETPLEFKEKAQELGISTGKYALFLQAKAQDLDISFEDLKEKGVAEALKPLGVNVGQIISQAQKDRNELKKTEEAFSREIKEKIQARNDDKDNEEKRPENKGGPHLREDQGRGNKARDKGKGEDEEEDKKDNHADNKDDDTKDEDDKDDGNDDEEEENEGEEKPPAGKGKKSER